MKHPIYMYFGARGLQQPVKCKQSYMFFLLSSLFYFISQKLKILFPHFWENIKRNQYLVISYIFVDFVVELINDNKMLIEEHTVLRKIMPTDYFATVVLFRSKSLILIFFSKKKSIVVNTSTNLAHVPYLIDVQTFII